MTVRKDRTLASIIVEDQTLSLSSHALSVDRAYISIQYVDRPMAAVGASPFSIPVGKIVETDYASVESILTRYLGVSDLRAPVELNGIVLTPDAKDDVRLETKEGLVLARGAIRAPSYNGAYMNVPSFLKGNQHWVQTMADWTWGMCVARVRGRYFIHKVSDIVYSKKKHRYFETYPYILRDLLALRKSGSKHRHYIRFVNGAVVFDGEKIDRVEFKKSVSRVFTRGLVMLERFGHLSRSEADAEVNPQDLQEYSCNWG
jgi:hypothetical protein